MAVSLRKARDFVFGSGTLFERALFRYLFAAGPLAHVHQCLLCYKNADGGWGNGLEHDLKCPDSHPAALEYLLFIHRDLGLPISDLLAGTPEWLERNQEVDGSLKNPPTLRDYPIAPWWNEWGGQRAPDSIVGSLTRLGRVTPALAASTRRWVQANHTLQSIRENDWLFMAYHAHDYFMNVDDYPEVEAYRHAVIENIAACAQAMPEKQYYVLFQFAPRPDSPVAQALPQHILSRSLDYLMETQQEDGHWSDEHGLPQWLSYATILSLNALRSYERL